jgi:hypothetical protein
VVLATRTCQAVDHVLVSLVHLVEVHPRRPRRPGGTCLRQVEQSASPAASPGPGLEPIQLRRHQHTRVDRRLRQPRAAGPRCFATSPAAERSHLRHPLPMEQPVHLSPVLHPIHLAAPHATSVRLVGHPNSCSDSDDREVLSLSTAGDRWAWSARRRARAQLVVGARGIDHGVHVVTAVVSLALRRSHRAAAPSRHDLVRVNDAQTGESKPYASGFRSRLLPNWATPVVVQRPARHAEEL